MSVRVDRLEVWVGTIRNYARASILLLIGAIATGVIDIALRAHK